MYELLDWCVGVSRAAMVVRWEGQSRVAMKCFPLFEGVWNGIYVYICMYVFVAEQVLSLQAGTVTVVFLKNNDVCILPAITI